MSKRSRNEPLLLGFIAAVVLTLGIVIPLILLAVFGDDHTETTTMQATFNNPAVQTVIQ